MNGLAKRSSTRSVLRRVQDKVDDTMNWYNRVLSNLIGRKMITRKESGKNPDTIFIECMFNKNNY